MTPQLCGCRSCTARIRTLSWSWCKMLTTMPTHLGSCLHWSLSWRRGASLCSTMRCACLRCWQSSCKHLPSCVVQVTASSDGAPLHAPSLMQCKCLAPCAVCLLLRSSIKQEPACLEGCQAVCSFHAASKVMAAGQLHWALPVCMHLGPEFLQRQTLVHEAQCLSGLHLHAVICTTCVHTGCALSTGCTSQQELLCPMEGGTQGKSYGVHICMPALGSLTTWYSQQEALCLMRLASGATLEKTYCTESAQAACGCCALWRWASKTTTFTPWWSGSRTYL